MTSDLRPRTENILLQYQAGDHQGGSSEFILGSLNRKKGQEKEKEREKRLWLLRV